MGAGDKASREKEAIRVQVTSSRSVWFNPEMAPRLSLGPACVGFQRRPSFSLLGSLVCRSDLVSFCVSAPLSNSLLAFFTFRFRSTIVNDFVLAVQNGWIDRSKPLAHRPLSPTSTSPKSPSLSPPRMVRLQNPFKLGKDLWDPSHRYETSWLIPPYALAACRAAFVRSKAKPKLPFLPFWGFGRSMCSPFRCTCWPIPRPVTHHPSTDMRNEHAGSNQLTKNLIRRACMASSSSSSPRAGTARTPTTAAASRPATASPTSPC